jgi:hypothetical protein
MKTNSDFLAAVIELCKTIKECNFVCIDYDELDTVNKLNLLIEEIETVCIEKENQNGKENNIHV